MEDEEETASYVPEIMSEQARKLGSIRLSCWRATEEEQDQRQPLQPVKINQNIRKPVVREVLKKDLVSHREGDKFLSSTVKSVESLYDGVPQAKSGTVSALARLLV